MTQPIGNNYASTSIPLSGNYLKKENNDSGVQANPEQGETQSVANEEKPQVSADDTLNFLAAQGHVPSYPSVSAIDVSEYVTAEQAQGIAAGIAEFEEMVAVNLEAIAQEFPNLSEEAQMELALSMIDDEMDN